MKVYVWNSPWLRNSVRLTFKKIKYLSLPNHQLAENLILVFVSKKGQKGDKSEFVTKFVFMKKNLSYC